MPGRLASEPKVHDGPVVPCIPHQARPPRRWRGPDRLTYNRIVRTGLQCRGVSSVNPVQLGNVHPRIDSEFGMQSVNGSRQPTGVRVRASASNSDPKRRRGFHQEANTGKKTDIKARSIEATSSARPSTAAGSADVGARIKVEVNFGRLCLTP